MKIKKSISIIIGLVFILTIFSGCSGTSSLIQLNVKKGDSYKVTQLSNQKISTSLNGEKMDTDQTLSMSYIYNIVDVDTDGTISIKVTFDSISQKQTNVVSTIEYDSKKDSAKTDPQSLAFNSLIGKEFSFKIGKDGSILSVDGIDEIFKNVISNINGIDSKTKNALIASLKQSFGNDAIKESLGQMINIYPSKEVKIGDSWKKDFTMNYGIPMEISSTMKLKGIKNDIVTIDIKSKIATNDSGEGLDITGLKMTYKISGKQTGTLKVYKSNGFMQNGELTQTLKGTANMAAFGQDMSMPVNIESKITYTSEKQK